MLSCTCRYGKSTIFIGRRAIFTGVSRVFDRPGFCYIKNKIKNTVHVRHVDIIGPQLWYVTLCATRATEFRERRESETIFGFFYRRCKSVVMRYLSINVMAIVADRKSR